ncbi:MAG: ATPase associated with various cellular activity 3 [Acidobacteria bacterium]|nr:ATPase associated with various cellular activity 3 [Acidobacteriota bacterium]
MDQATETSGIQQAQSVIQRLRDEVSHVIVGQEAIVDRLVIALLIRGHVLLEGLPGLAKTLLVKTLASAIDASFKRIQFTPDLLPADITGTLIFDPAGREFNPRFGPIFANLILADEINRAPAKVQSALLEAMQERQVTIGATTYPLPEPFVVIATQNPIEHEGTYALPEAQVDRFVMKLNVGYPTADEELRILSMYLDATAAQTPVRRVLKIEEIAAVAKLASGVHVDERISRYIVQLVTATRRPAEFRLAPLAPYITFGASPRATLALAHVAKAYAFIQGRSYVVPEDIKAIAPDVLRHRLVLSYEAAAEQMSPDAIVSQVLNVVPVP